MKHLVFWAVFFMYFSGQADQLCGELYRDAKEANKEVKFTIPALVLTLTATGGAAMFLWTFFTI